MLLDSYNTKSIEYNPYRNSIDREHHSLYEYFEFWISCCGAKLKIISKINLVSHILQDSHYSGIYIPFSPEVHHFHEEIV